MLSNPDDWVLDPFVGMGTTAVAAIETDRNYICFERDAKYIEMAIEEIYNAKEPD